MQSQYYVKVTFATRQPSSHHHALKCSDYLIQIAPITAHRKGEKGGGLPLFIILTGSKASDLNNKDVYKIWMDWEIVGGTVVVPVDPYAL